MIDTTEDPDQGVRWQGGCELRDGAAVRVGNLYVTEKSLYFIEAGRADIGRFRGSITLAGIAGGLLLVPVSLAIYGLTWAPAGATAFKLGFGLAGVAVLALAWRHYQGVLARYEADLAALGEPTDLPDPALLGTITETILGNERVPLLDIERLTPDGRWLELVTRLGERWSLRIVPSPDAFVEAVRAGGGLTVTPASAPDPPA